MVHARTPLAVALVLAGVLGMGIALGQATTAPQMPGWLSGVGTDPEPGEALAPSRPVRIAIPSLDVRARVRPVGLDERGAIASPPMRRAHETGWYEDGPTPGQYGPAVIVGHVDDARDRAVFHDLANVGPGTQVEVTRRDRTTAVFQVTGVRTFDKSALPPDEVYGDFQEPGLRLITCGGRWVGGGTGYADNIVVFATLVDWH